MEKEQNLRILEMAVKIAEASSNATMPSVEHIYGELLKMICSGPHPIESEMMFYIRKNAKGFDQWASLYDGNSSIIKEDLGARYRYKGIFGTLMDVIVFGNGDVLFCGPASSKEEKTFYYPEIFSANLSDELSERGLEEFKELINDYCNSLLNNSHKTESNWVETPPQG